MLILILLSSAARFVPDFIATNLVLLIAFVITANFSVVLRVQIVLVVHEVVHAAVVAVELLMGLRLIVAVELLIIASDAAIDDV